MDIQIFLVSLFLLFYQSTISPPFIIISVSDAI